jgi:hypothetical protein
MSIMSIESIDKRDFDPLDQAAVVGAVQEVQTKYEERIRHFETSYNTSELRNDPNEQSPGLSPITVESIKSHSNNSWLYMWLLLMKRSFLNQLRLPQQSYIKLFSCILVGLFAVAVYGDIGDDLAGV